MSSAAHVILIFMVVVRLVRTWPRKRTLSFFLFQKKDRRVEQALQTYIHIKPHVAISQVLHHTGTAVEIIIIN